MADLVRVDATRLRRVAAAAIGVFALVLIVLFVVVEVAARDASGVPGNVVVFVVASAVGFLLAFRLPRLPIGWLLLAAVVLGLLQALAKAYLLLDYHHHYGTLGLGSAAVVLAAGLGFSPTIALAAALMLVPDGRPPSPRWRWVSWTYFVLGVIFLVGQLAAEIGVLGQRIHLDLSGTPTNTPTGVYAIFGYSFGVVVLLLPIWAAWIVYQVGNFRRSSGPRRQQMKWLVAGGIVSAVLVIVGSSLRNTPGIDTVLFQASRVGIAAFPIAIAFAVLRYRLYDLERVISRTVSYAVLTGIVVGVYAAVVTLTTKAFGFSSPVAVAASTLAVVAAFNPLRRRLQRVVDRRFNRSRYDRERTVDAYRSRIRDVVDPAAVQRDLLETVDATFQPAHAVLWLQTRQD